MPEDTSEIPLAEMIETLREELQIAKERGKGRSVAFEIEKVELELKVAVSRKTKAEGGVAFWVVKAGAAVEGTNDTIHTFKLTLSPVSPKSGGRLIVRDEADQPATRD